MEWFENHHLTQKHGSIHIESYEKPEGMGGGGAGRAFKYIHPTTDKVVLSEKFHLVAP